MVTFIGLLALGILLSPVIDFVIKVVVAMFTKEVKKSAFIVKATETSNELNWLQYNYGNRPPKFILDIKKNNPWTNIAFWGDMLLDRAKSAEWSKDGARIAQIDKELDEIRASYKAARNQLIETIKEQV